ncbi:hypothetical protein SDC9_206553 [bioreactor metagenome]|uniref:Uncharacterized protein n=1 Tax=bioreactor metagenome TaxID=1076179 RepID=A0A645J624_9ZZZZ
MQAGNRRKDVFHAPVDGRLREMSPDVADDRQIVDDIAERRGFDEQDAHRRGTAKTKARL